MDNNKERVKYLLQHKDELKESYAKQEIRLMEGIETETEAIEGIQLRSKEIKDFIPGKTNKVNDPIFSVLMELGTFKMEVIEEMKQGLKELAMKQRELAKLEAAFEKLEIPLQKIISCLYFEKLTWAETCFKMDCSKSTGMRKHNQALKKLFEYFGNDTP